MRAFSLVLLLALTGCVSDHVKLLAKAKAAKDGGGEVCFPVFEPEDVVGRYCLRYEGAPK